MPHILIVDDDADLREMVSFFLETEGYTVTTADNGEIALEKFHKQPSDLVLLDLMMPKVDGIETCWRLREISEVPIVILTAIDKDIEQFWDLEPGANAYLSKPFEMDELLLTIESFLEENSSAKFLPDLKAS